MVPRNTVDLLKVCSLTRGTVLSVPRRKNRPDWYGAPDMFLVTGFYSSYPPFSTRDVYIYIYIYIYIYVTGIIGAARCQIDAKRNNKKHTHTNTHNTRAPSITSGSPGSRHERVMSELGFIKTARALHDTVNTTCAHLKERENRRGVVVRSICVFPALGFFFSTTKGGMVREEVLKTKKSSNSRKNSEGSRPRQSTKQQQQQQQQQQRERGDRGKEEAIRGKIKTKEEEWDNKSETTDW